MLEHFSSVITRLATMKKHEGVSAISGPHDHDLQRIWTMSAIVPEPVSQRVHEIALEHCYKK